MQQAMLDMLDEYHIDYDPEEGKIWCRHWSEKQPHLTDAILMSLGGLQAINEIRLISCHDVRGSFLRNMVHQPIREIHMIGCPFSDAAAEYLPHFDALNVLRVTGTELSDQGVAHIARCAGLKDLMILGGTVSDVGVGMFAKLECLVHLGLNLPRASSEALQALRRTMPGCQISFSSPR